MLKKRQSKKKYLVVRYAVYCGNFKEIYFSPEKVEFFFLIGDLLIASFCTNNGPFLENRYCNELFVNYG